MTAAEQRQMTDTLYADGVAHQPAGESIGIQLEDGLEQTISRLTADGIAFPGKGGESLAAVYGSVGQEKRQRYAGLPAFAQDQVERRKRRAGIISAGECAQLGDDDGADVPGLHGAAERLGVHAGRNPGAPCAKRFKQRLHECAGAAAMADQQDALTLPCGQQLVDHAFPSFVPEHMPGAAQIVCPD